MRFDPGNRLIVALDVTDAAAARALALQVGDAASWVKVGLELFIAEGPAVVAAARAAGHRVMLDLKLHDIPETVARAMTQADRSIDWTISCLSSSSMSIPSGGISKP